MAVPTRTSADVKAVALVMADLTGKTTTQMKALILAKLG